MLREKVNSTRKFLCVFLFPLVISSSSLLAAQQQNVEETDDVFEMPLEQLMEIEVVSPASLTKTKPRLVPSAVTTITQEDIWSSNARSLYELLDIYVPNLQWMRHHWEADVMGLRGIISDRNDKYLLLVNGRVMNERTHFGAVTEQDLVMLSDVHHIDVIRGPGSALYGPGAVSMVINIVTHSSDTFQGTEVLGRMGVVEEFYSAEVKHGRKFKDDDGGLFVYTGIGNYVGASKYDAPQIFPFTFPLRSDYAWNAPGVSQGPPVFQLPGDGIRSGDPATSLPLTRDGADARGRMPLKLHLQIKRGNWDIWARYTRGGKNFVWSAGSLLRHPWGWADWNNNWGWNGAALSAGSTGTVVKPAFYSYQQATGFVGYKQELTEDIDVDYSISYDMTDFERFIDNRIEDAYREDKYNGKVVVKWQPNEKHSIAFGTEWEHRELGMKSPGWPDGSDYPRDRTFRLVSAFKPHWAWGHSMPRWSTNLLSFFGEHQWTINDKWTTFVGARLDEHTYTDSMFSPRAAIVHTPTDIDTYKLMWSRSVRSNFEEEMKVQSVTTGGDSEPEILDNIELRYERQHSKNLDLAASVFVHYNLEAISWNNTTASSVSTGEQREYGFELEASYHTDKTRVLLSHGFTKLYDFDLERGRSTYISAEPYGHGDDLTNWANNITKLTAQHDLNDKWTLDASMRIYWGYWGMKDYDDYYPYTGTGAAQSSNLYYTWWAPTGPYTQVWPAIDNHWKRAYRPSYFLNIGLQYKHSENLVVNLTAYNLLGVLNKDFNKRNYVQTAGGGDFRSHAAALGISLLYKF